MLVGGGGALAEGGRGDAGAGEEVVSREGERVCEGIAFKGGRASPRAVAVRRSRTAVNRSHSLGRGPSWAIRVPYGPVLCASRSGSRGRSPSPKIKTISSRDARPPQR